MEAIQVLQVPHGVPIVTKPVLQRLKCMASKYLRMYTLCATFVSLGGFLFGFDTGSIGPITVMTQFEAQFSSISPSLQGLIVSTILITASIFSFLAGPLSNRISRIYTIALGGLVFATGSAVSASAFSLPQLFVGRAITGAGEGLFLSTITVYTCEIAPASVRGRLSCLTQLGVTLGVASGYFICYGTVRHPGSFAWRFPFSMQAVVASILALGTPFLPHSPRWLRNVGRQAASEHAWTRLQVNQTEAEKEELAQRREERQGKRASFVEEIKLLGKKGYRGRTALGCFLMGMQQASGIDGVLYYAPVLFTQAGLSSAEAAFLASGVSGLLNVACTLITVPFLDRWGRRPTTIIGGALIGCIMVTIGSIYASNGSSTSAGRWTIIVLIYLFVVAFATTWAVVNRIYCSEIQPNETRAAATSLGQCANWTVNWIIAFTTPLFLARSVSGPYFLFGACSLFTALVCVAFQPETRGISLEGNDDAFANSPWEKMVRNVRLVIDTKHERARNRRDVEELGGRNEDAQEGLELDVIEVRRSRDIQDVDNLQKE